MFLLLTYVAIRFLLRQFIPVDLFRKRNDFTKLSNIICCAARSLIFDVVVGFQYLQTKICIGYVVNHSQILKHTSSSLSLSQHSLTFFSPILFTPEVHTCVLIDRWHHRVLHSHQLLLSSQCEEKESWRLFHSQYFSPHKCCQFFLVLQTQRSFITHISNVHSLLHPRLFFLFQLTKSSIFWSPRSKRREEKEGVNIRRIRLERLTSLLWL